jgi:hypothetical protein
MNKTRPSFVWTVPLGLHICPFFIYETIAEVIVNISGECPQAEYLKAVSVQGTVPPDVSPSDVKAKEVFQKVKTVFGINFTI